MFILCLYLFMRIAFQSYKFVLTFKETDWQLALCFVFMPEIYVGYKGFTIQCTETGPQLNCTTITLGQTYCVFHSYQWKHNSWLNFARIKKWKKRGAAFWLLIKLIKVGHFLVSEGTYIKVQRLMLYLNDLLIHKNPDQCTALKCPKTLTSWEF